MPVKILIFWLFITAVLWLLSKLQYWFSNTSYTWNYYREHISTFWGMYLFCMLGGTILLTIYLFVQLALWWFAG